MFNVNPCAPRRRGFTLIELLVVLVIIAILAAFLLPAITRAFVRGQRVRQVEEISALNNALEAFKAKYGIYPPSRIRLREHTQYNLSDEFDAHSVKYLTRLWPNIALQIATAGNPATTPSPLFLWADDGADATYELEGDECLVFFLGGIPQAVTGGSIVLHGFTKSATNPSGVPNSSLPITLQRDDPLFKFDAGRLFSRTGNQIAPAVVGQNPNPGWEDFPGASSPRPINKLLSYRAIGSQPGSPPIAYFSSYEGQGYRPNDVCIPETDPVESLPAAQKQRYDYQIVWPGIKLADRADAGSQPPYPYTETLPNPTATTANAIIRYLNPTSYQLIAPGPDNLYGPGMQLPRPSSEYTDDVQPGGAADDNLSNISGSQTVGEFNRSRNQ